MTHVKLIKRQFPACGTGSGLTWLALSFLVGAAASALTSGLLIMPGGDFFAWSSGGGMVRIFFSCAFFALCSLVFFTSLLGPVLLPVCAFALGASVSAQAASIISSGQQGVLICVVEKVIVPALLIVPPFFLQSCWGMKFAGLIVSGQPAYTRRAGGGYLALFSAIALALAFAAAAYIIYLMPGT